MFQRFGRDRPASTRATAGDVFVAVSRDPWARERLGEVYRKLFEGAGVRQGSSPDHFVYVSPGRARAEIREVSAWIGERFGDPAGTVPATTPFGYLSGRYDGWVTLFSALSYGEDRELAQDFVETVARMSWASYGAASPRSSTSPSSVEEPREEPVRSQPAPAPETPFFLRPYAARGRAASPSTGKVIVTPAPSAPAPAKPGVIGRFLGVKTEPASKPASTATGSGETAAEHVGVDWLREQEREQAEDEAFAREWLKEKAEDEAFARAWRPYRRERAEKTAERTKTAEKTEREQEAEAQEAEAQRKEDEAIGEEIARLGRLYEPIPPEKLALIERAREEARAGRRRAPAQPIEKEEISTVERLRRPAGAVRIF